MIDRVTCDDCGKTMINVEGSTNHSGVYDRVYECRQCDNTFFITILQGTRGRHVTAKAQSDDTECDCCDGSCKESIGKSDDYEEKNYKHPICPICTERHAGICEGFKEHDKDCCDNADDYPVKWNDDTNGECRAPEPAYPTYSMPRRIRWIISAVGMGGDEAKRLESDLNEPKNDQKFYVLTKPVTVQRIED